MENVSGKVIEFQRDGKGLGELMQDLAPAVYQFPRRRMGLDEDACGEFYIRFQPRLARMLARYQDRGRSFDAYLKTCLGWQLRNFARTRRAGERSWEAVMRMTADGEPSPDASPAPCIGIPRGIAAVVRTPADRRNFLFLALKCPGLADDPKAEAAAAVAGVPLPRLRALEAALAERGAARRERLGEFAARRNRAFCAARLLETELRCEVDPGRRQVLQARLQKARARMRTAMARMAKVGLAPTNREIAEALGVPKGTVDSGLYVLKRKLAALLDTDSQRSA